MFINKVDIKNEINIQYIYLSIYYYKTKFPSLLLRYVGFHVDKSASIGVTRVSSLKTRCFIKAI